MKKNFLGLFLSLILIFTITGCENKEKFKTSVGAVMSLSVEEFSETSVTLNWEKVSGVTGYEVYISQNDSDKLFSTTEDTTIVVMGLEKNKEYTFKVCGIIQNGDSVTRGALAEISGCTYREKVGEISSFLLSAKNLSLTWESVDADGYEVYSYDEETNEFLLEKSVADNYCKIVNLKPDTEYEFKIIPFKNFSSGKIYGQETTTKASTIGEDDISLSVENVTPSSYTIVWNEIKNAEGYDVFVFNDETQEFDVIAENIIHVMT